MRVADGKELFERQLRYASPRREIARWVADDGRLLAEEFELAWRELAERVRQVVWTVNPQCDTVSSFASFLEQQIGQFLRATSLRVTLDFPEDIPASPLSAEARYQLALSVREALANAVRHAGATEVVVSLALASETLVVQVRDNGRGFTSPEQSGHGLANIRSRLEQIGGRFDCVSKAGAGTALEFRLPLRPTALRRKPSV